MQLDTLWTLSKRGKVRACRLLTHQLGWKLRVESGDLLLTQVCRSDREIEEVSAAAQWGQSRAGAYIMAAAKDVGRTLEQYAVLYRSPVMALPGPRESKRPGTRCLVLTPVPLDLCFRFSVRNWQMQDVPIQIIETFLDLLRLRDLQTTSCGWLVVIQPTESPDYTCFDN